MKQNESIRRYLAIVRAAETPALRQALFALSSAPESAQEDGVSSIIEQDELGGLWLAWKLYQSRQQHERLLQAAIRRADASGIRLWLAVAAPRVGALRYVQILADQFGRYPAGVSKALYWSEIIFGNAVLTREPAFEALTLRAKEYVHGVEGA